MNVIITGASRGLGKSIAEKFASDGGNHIILMCARGQEQLEATAAELKQQYPESSFRTLACDLSRKEEAHRFAAWAEQEIQSVDVLVNNAGLFIPGSVHDESDGSLEEMITVNLYSAYHLTRALLPRMISAQTGHIFNMCSIAALKAYANGGSYSISKFALLGFSKNLREEMKPHNIKVTSVLPGAAYTDAWAASGIDQQRFMEAADIAELVYVSAHLSPRACVEEIIVRPQLGDI